MSMPVSGPMPTSVLTHARIVFYRRFNSVHSLARIVIGRKGLPFLVPARARFYEMALPFGPLQTGRACSLKDLEDSSQACSVIIVRFPFL